MRIRHTERELVPFLVLPSFFSLFTQHPCSHGEPRNSGRRLLAIALNSMSGPRRKEEPGGTNKRRQARDSHMNTSTMMNPYEHHICGTHPPTCPSFTSLLTDFKSNLAPLPFRVLVVLLLFRLGRWHWDGWSRFGHHRVEGRWLNIIVSEVVFIINSFM